MLKSSNSIFKQIALSIKQRQAALKTRETQNLAYKFYQDRQLQDRKVTRQQDQTNREEEKDWDKAEKKLEKSKIWQVRQVLFFANLPFFYIEKLVVEPFANWLDRADIFRIVTNLSPLFESIGVVLIPVILFFSAQAYQEQQQQQELERSRQESLANYLENISSIVLEVGGDLRDPENEEVRELLRALTLAQLRDPHFDGERKGQLIYILSKLKFIQAAPNLEADTEEKPLISLEATDLREVNLSRSGIRGEPTRSFRQANYEISKQYLLFFSGEISKELDELMSRGIDLQGVDLRFSYLNGSRFNYANLSHSNLQFSDFLRADLSGANLTYADLRHSIFSYANLENAQLSHAKLSFTNFKYANLSGANFENTDLTDTVFWKSHHLENAKLDGAIFCRTVLPNGVFNNTDCDSNKVEPKRE